MAWASCWMDSGIAVGEFAVVSSYSTIAPLHPQDREAELSRRESPFPIGVNLSLKALVSLVHSQV